MKSQRQEVIWVLLPALPQVCICQGHSKHFDAFDYLILTAILSGSYKY